MLVESLQNLWPVVVAALLLGLRSVLSQKDELSNRVAELERQLKNVTRKHTEENPPSGPYMKLQEPEAFTQREELMLDQMYRNEHFPTRAKRGRVCLIGFVMAVFLMHFLAILNPNNQSLDFNPTEIDFMHQLQHGIVPCMGVLCLIFCGISKIIKNEFHHQILWCIVGFTTLLFVATNEVVWRLNYAPEINSMLNKIKSSNPVGLFYLNEVGWFLTVVLVFLTVMVRPRFPYLIVLTWGSFGIFLGGCYFLRQGIAIHSILLRSVVYFFCCLFNIVSSWNLEQSERRAWFMSKDLERKLKFEKVRLQKEAEETSKSELILVGYVCNEIRVPMAALAKSAESTLVALSELLPVIGAGACVHACKSKTYIYSFV
jgi:hypothetical protein